MENASKALIIAGGVLLAILILGLLVYTWTTMGNFTSQAEEQKRLEQLTAFNRQYEVYQRQILRGSDIASVINKVRDNNKFYADNPEMHITWQFKIKKRTNVQLDGREIIPNGTYDEQHNINVYNNLLKNSTDFKDFKSLYFYCESIEYSNKTGRVNKIVFNEKLYREVYKTNDE